MRCLTAVGLLVITLATDHSAIAADRQRIRTINISSQAVMTLVSGVIQRKVHTLSDVLRCLGSGAVGGYGSYQAKILVSKGEVQTGWLIANVATSLSENAVAGRNPISQLGYTIGPIRLRIAMPRLDREGDSYVYVDVSEYETIALIRSFQNNDRVRLRSGMVAFERDTPYPAEDGVGPFSGTAWGVYPAVWVGARREVWHHEVIHAIQSLQGSAVEPSFAIFTYKPNRRINDRRRFIRFEHLKLGIVNFGDDYMTGRQEYEQRWTEIEAYRIAQDRDP